MTKPPADLIEKLKEFQQEHLVQWWPELSDGERTLLTQQIVSVPFEVIQSVLKCSGSSPSASDSASRIDAAKSPAAVVRQPLSDQDRADWSRAQEIGEELLSNCKIAVITVAGGQGSRLGFDHPKGMFPIGPATDRSLFQIFAEQILARKRRHGAEIPWLIMTSAATHGETLAFFERHSYFGLQAKSVRFFQQGTMPAVSSVSGKVLMSDKSSLCLSPDGHGGLVTALQSSGLQHAMKDQGIEHAFYHQVDNPTAILCDPALIGLHHSHKSQLTTNVVKKVSPTERMGVLVDAGGQTEIIEYSELNEEQAQRKDESGQWIFWAGNTAIHVFARSFLEELTNDGCQLELHLASKKVPHINDTGKLVNPKEPNAHKFERFIFDALPLAERALIVEGNRDREFNPVKNAEGRDSPTTARSALERIYRQWLQEAGVPQPDGRRLEVSPLQALDAAELKQKLQSGELTVDDISHA